ncbi:MAG: SGNH/GDSL hydrolase family protein [Planctomycetota bacterium]|jgi:lysophospholipase L1-like esterase
MPRLIRRRLYHTWLLLLLPLSTALACPLCQGPLLFHDFADDPVTAGWSLKPTPGHDATVKGAHRARDEANPTGSIHVNQGLWQSPPLTTTPHRYYQVILSAKGDERMLWGMNFFDENEKSLTADHNSGIDASPEWVEQNFFFRGKTDAVQARFQFYPGNPRQQGRVHLSKVLIAPASLLQVLAWSDRFMADLPAVDYPLPANRRKHLPRTVDKLQRGEPITLVLLGDSIANDIGNAPLDLLLQRLYPKSRVKVITAVRGGTGCWYYKEGDRIQSQVLRHKPDLVILSSISERNDLGAIAEVLRQLKSAEGIEILLTTGPITPDAFIVRTVARLRRITVEEAERQHQAFLSGLAALGKREKVAFLDLRRHWNAYMAKATAQQHLETSFLRDPVHANARGRQVAVRLLTRYFTPEEGE